MTTTHSLQWAQHYHGHGLAVVPALRGKPASRLKGWNTSRIEADKLPEHFNGDCNLVLVFGELSDGVVGIDFDWPIASRLAQELGWYSNAPAFGRGEDLYTHYLVRCPEVLKTASWKCPAGRSANHRPIVEVLSDHQCLAPGSIHKDGAPVSFAPSRSLQDQNIPDVDQAMLYRQLDRIAGGAWLLENWQTFTGGRHDLTLALAGACLNSGTWTPDEVELFLAAFFRVADDEERRDRLEAVRSTATNFQRGQTLLGVNALNETLSTDFDWLSERWQLQPDPHFGLIGVQPTTSTTGPSLPQITASAGDVWPELIPFDSTHGESLEYPVAALGDNIAEVVRAVERVQQVPFGLAAHCVLGAISAAVQGLFDVRVTYGVLPTSLYLLTLGETGERKSWTEKLLFRAHTEWMNNELALYAGVPKEDQPPWKPYLIFETGTIEGLIKKLALFWPSIIGLNSDAADFVEGHSFRDGRGTRSAAVLSKLWDGELRSYMRATDPQPISLYGRRLSLNWMLQPALVSSVISDQNRDQGLLSRFLMSFPESRIGYRKTYDVTELDRGILSTFDSRVTALLSQKPVMDLETGVMTPTALELDPKAETDFQRIIDHYEHSLRKEALNFPIRDQANKAAQQVARLAGVITGWEDASIISADRLEGAKLLVDYYLTEWREVSTRLGAMDATTKKAIALLDWLEKYLKDNPGPFKLAPLYQLGPRECGRRAAAIKELLSLLMKHGYVRAIGGNQYELRPSIADG